MEFKNLNGRIYCRPALTPPVVNSDLAGSIGLKAPSDMDLETGGNVPLKPGSNVKIRALLDGGEKRMTFHAKIHDFDSEVHSGKAFVYFDQLSLSDSEFRLLMGYMVDDEGQPLEIEKTLRKIGARSSPFLPENQINGQTRVKAVTMPISLIEMIDENRGAIGFSDYVTKAVITYINQL